MYKVLTVEDKIRVPPVKFRMKVDNAVKSSLEDKWSGIIEKDLGVILSVISVDDIGEGKIIPGDGAIHYPVNFNLLVYRPDLHEIIKGNVIDVTEFGVFIRLGPVDGMIHVSQIMNDFVSYDQKNSVFMGRESKNVIKEGDIVKARIISVSMEGKQYKIGLTTRQPNLGALSWLDKAKKPAAKKKAPEKPKKKGKKRMSIKD